MMLNSLSSPELYRHYKGGYYIVHSIATVEADCSQVVVYQGLVDGRMWTRPFDNFFEELSNSIENPTGQKHRFEKVVMFDNPLSNVSTDKLVEELEKRGDNPFVALMHVNPSDYIFREEFVVGTVCPVYISESESFEDLDVDTVWNTLEEAKSRVYNHPMGGLQVFKRVFVKVDL